MSAVACFDCGYGFDAASNPFDLNEEIGTAKPPAGSVSVCIRCGACAVFTGTGIEMRPPTDEERAEFAANPSIQRVRRGLAFTRTRTS